MKYVITWQSRQMVTEEMEARGLQIFSKWSPSESATFHEFLGRVDGRGGFAVVETDDPTTIARDAALFGTFFEFDVHPVMEMAEVAAVAGEAVATRASIS